MLVIYIIFSVQLYLVLTLNTCETRTKCKECILDPSFCDWCGMDNFTGTRCRSANLKDSNWCPGLLQNLRSNASITPENNLPFNSTPGHVIQIRPQRNQLELRLGQPYEFSFSFQGVEKFPVDLYFIFDSSKTMKARRESAAAQSEYIYEKIKKLTDDIYLGLGLFVDKNAFPYTNFQDKKIYSFKNRLKLVDNQTKFRDELETAPSLGNVDFQEGGLDALAQAMACKEIGWRNESRKIIVFLSDGPYHAAGDGRAAGIFTPFDGKCHLSNGSYTRELTMDYPSAGMINKLATENDFIIIFLVASSEKFDIEGIYKKLSAAVRGSKVKLYNNTDKNDNEVALILEDIYKEITRKIKLKVHYGNGKRSNYELSFKPNCMEDSNSSDCDINIKTEQKFTGTIKLVKYDGVPNTSLDVILEGIGEKLTLDINVIDNCDSCPSELKSDYCNGELRHCGACECGPTRVGDTCACVKNWNMFDGSNCIPEGSEVSCSGRGPCICGSCNCTSEYQGKYCECNKNSCSVGKNDLPCSGGEQGKCVCDPVVSRDSYCVCTDDWAGNACDCYKSEDKCKTGKNITCNDRGKCECGTCKCDAIAQWDGRHIQDTFCKVEPCTDCHSRQCWLLEECVRCKYFGEDVCASCSEGISAATNITIPQESPGLEGWKLCNSIRVGVGCYAQYVYRYEEERYGIQVAVQSHANCAVIHYMIGGISVGAVLLVGLGTLIGWKLLTDARDRQEYEKFAKAHSDFKDDFENNVENPLYSPPVKVVNNPHYGRPSVF